RWLRSTGLPLPGRALCLTELCAGWFDSCGVRTFWAAQMLRQHVRAHILQMSQPGAWDYATRPPLGHGRLLNAKE
ncbi:MAG TPA: hypothetical protein PKD65_19435, partial [Nitrospira sp.]|nr:hypothetical protein [Nitrospira sp.]